LASVGPLFSIPLAPLQEGVSNLGRAPPLYGKLPSKHGNLVRLGFYREGVVSGAFPPDILGRDGGLFLRCAINMVELLPSVLPNLGTTIMTCRHNIGFAAVMLCVLGLAGSASESQGSIFVTNLVNGSNPLPIPGSQAWGGQLGDDFVTGASALAINRVGVFDSNGNGTTVDILWRLFEVVTGNVVFETTVPASGARTPGPAVVESNYVFLDLLSDLILQPNTAYSAVAVGFGTGNENFNTNISPTTTDVVFSSDGLTAAGGRFSNPGDNTLPTSNGATDNTVSTQPYNFGAATFVYGTAAVPEPASALVWSLIMAIGALAYGRRTLA
jgi:hypothetical protein